MRSAQRLYSAIPQTTSTARQKDEKRLQKVVTSGLKIVTQGQMPGPHAVGTTAQRRDRKKAANLPWFQFDTQVALREHPCARHRHQTRPAALVNEQSEWPCLKIRARQHQARSWPRTPTSGCRGQSDAVTAPDAAPDDDDYVADSAVAGDAEPQRPMHTQRLVKTII